MPASLLDKTGVPICPWKGLSKNATILLIFKVDRFADGGARVSVRRTTQRQSIISSGLPRRLFQLA